MDKMIERLTDENYEVWATQVKSMLVIKGLWSNVANNLKATEEDTKNDQALAYITLSVTPGQLRHIKGETTPNGACVKLQSIHQKRGVCHEWSLYKRLTDAKCDDKGDLHGHIETFFKTVDELSEIGVNINEKVLVYMLLKGLPSSMEYFVVAITTRDELPSLTDMKHKILEEVSRQTTATTTPNNESEAAFLARNKTKQWKSSGIKCYNCGETGHISRNCPKNNKGRKSNTERQNDRKVSGFYAVANQAVVAKPHNWILDSGANNHLVCDRTKLYNERRHNSTIKVVGGTTRANTVGEAKINTKYGSLEMKNALYVPENDVNLLSVDRATEANCEVLFKKNGAIIFSPDGQPIITARKLNGLYVVNEIDSPNSNNAPVTEYYGDTSSGDNDKNWHRRMGHLNYKSLYGMSKSESVIGIDNIRRSRCDCQVCYENKMSEAAYPKEAQNRAVKVLERIHSDICGPFKQTGVNGSKYFITFVDDYSRLVKVYTIKSRDEVPRVFQHYKNLMENQTGERIKIFRSDNAAEYKGGEMRKILQDSGIIHETSVPHSPQQNGTAERFNRTLVEMARCMLSDTHQPTYLWDEAIHTASYIRNRCPTAANHNTTPFELFWGRKPSVSHMRVFGCKAIAIVKTGQRNKLQQRAQEYIFVGYSTGQKGYRLYDKRTRQLVVSRSVKFFENDQPPEDYLHGDDMLDNEVDFVEGSQNIKSNNISAIYDEPPNTIEDADEPVKRGRLESSEAEEGDEERAIRRGPDRTAKQPRVNMAYRQQLEPASFSEASTSRNHREW